MFIPTLIANKFLELGDKDKNALTPMQLLKLVYIAHGWMLGLYKRPLISEKVEAWQYGPVIPELYHSIKQYRSSPVKKIDIHISTSEIDKDGSDIIKQVYDKYANFSGPQLSMLTHAKNTPWYKTWNSRVSTISNDLIEDYYTELAKKYSN